MEKPNEYFDTFGRVDGTNYTEEVCCYESEDNYSCRVIVSVLKAADGTYTWGTQFISDDPDPEAEWPKLVIHEQNIKDETAAIEEAERHFNTFYHH